MSNVNPEIAKILADHKAWRKDADVGVRADLRYADLSSADLSYANLSKSVLCDACLNGARISYRGKLVIVEFKEVEDGTQG